ncbi:regulatory solute carrier protein family 1 member 1 isoform X2 [Heterocephalus glaber]|uniref:Regulatory solute carrier protein family 1 member 1 isoform X2 n=2 Tax=Heterocephalus glaber TaxID=10181 RepID=A0AAX6PG03_HETGA|nr:regulatory solute carrier protein family 1 member 1 isoform X2 [Heterocephalus glaber]
MLLTVYCVRRDLSEVTFSLQVDADFELHNFRALCELESGIPAAESQLVYAERPLTDNHRSLASYGLKDGDVVILRQKENADPRPAVQFPNLPRIDFSSIAVPGTSSPCQRQAAGAQQPHSSPGEIASSPQGLDNPALLRDMLLANPHELSLLKERNPPLAEALLSGDLERFSRVLVEQQQDRARREQERIRLFSADPFDLEAQAKIEEDIRQQNIEENMTIAMEEAPESFGQVVMLYINCKVNGHPVKAFVDSGAQMTIMSQSCAERCNIMRLVDRRWAGIAKGVGTQKIIGRVHLAQVQIEGDFLACSFSILEEQPMDMLLGLDMLKRHQCSIDLKKNVLVIGTTGSQTTFLPEGELPECARLAYGTGREDIRPEEIADQELAEAIQKSAEDAEKSGKESTSLGMSSLPTSDGFTPPAHSSGPSPEIGNPTSLAHSASASVCPIEPSDPDSIQPKAVKALKASVEFQMNSKKKELLPLQDPSDHASSADQSPAMPLHNSSEEAVIRDNLEKSAERSSQGLKLYLHTRQEASLSVTTARMHEPLMLVDKKGWHPENQNLRQLNGLHQHTEPGNKQHEVQQNAPHDQGHLCDLGDIQLPEEKQQDQQKIVGLKASMKEEGLQQNSDLPSPEKSFLPSGCFGSSNSEMLMEIEVVEQSVVAVLKSTGSQNANVENIGVSSLTSDNPLMEVETSKCNPSSASVNNSISTQDLQPPESNIEMSGTNNEYGNSLPSLNLCGSCQPSVESTEESCSSVTAALKELHELLVSSSKPAPENTSKVICQSETIPEGQTGVKDFSERWTQNDHLAHREPCPQVFCHQASSVSVKSESLGAVSGTGTEDTEDSSSQGQSDGLSADKKGVPRFRESVSESNSVTITSAESSNQLHCTLGVEISPSLTASEDALSQTSEQTESLPSSFILVKDLGRGIQSLVTDRLETRENACPDTARPFLELDPLTSHPSSPSLLSPLIFPATDIDRILRAGFTLQEALGALHRVGGNADLALLVLLAKNIVVPT